MEKNKKAARIHQVLALIYGLGSTIFLLFAFSIPAESTPMAYLFAAFITLSAIHFSIAYGAKQGRNWARNASRIIAIPMLFGFPIGTFVGGALLAASWNPWDSDVA